SLRDLMLLSKATGNIRLAIYYGKQAVNIYQQIRQHISLLEEETQKAYLKSKEDTYRVLADFLISQGQLPEAEQVLSLLKVEEYEQLARRGEKADTIPYSQAEADVIAKIENLVALERQRTELQKLQKETGSLSGERLKKLEQLRLDIAAANKAFDNALDALGKAEQSAQTRVDEIKNGQELQ